MCDALEVRSRAAGQSRSHGHLCRVISFCCFLTSVHTRACRLPRVKLQEKWQMVRDALTPKITQLEAVRLVVHAS